MYIIIKDIIENSNFKNYILKYAILKILSKNAIITTCHPKKQHHN